MARKKKSAKIKISVPGLPNYCILELKDNKSGKKWRVIKGVKEVIFKLKRQKKGLWLLKYQKTSAFYKVTLLLEDNTYIRLKKIPMNFLTMGDIVADGDFEISNLWDDNKIYGKWEINEIRGLK